MCVYKKLRRHGKYLPPTLWSYNSEEKVSPVAGENGQTQEKIRKIYLYEYIYISTTLTRRGNIWNNISTTVCLPIPAKNSISAVQHHPQSSVVNITRGWWRQILLSLQHKLLLLLWSQHLDLLVQLLLILYKWFLLKNSGPKLLKSLYKKVWRG